MSLLIHATITVAGDAALLEPCNLCIKELLAGQITDGEIDEFHGADALCYDLKLKGGIPFTPFVEASQQFPSMKIVAEWVDVAAGVRGAATIVNGQLAEHRIDALDTAARSARPAHIAVDGSGRLELALTCFRANHDEWLGYALTADRDALFRIVRAPQSDAVELFATEGEAQWCLHWRSSVAQSGCDGGAMAESREIAQSLYRELEQMALDFTAEWMWFAAAPQIEIAIEQERYARAGYATHPVNVKASRLHRMLDAGATPENRFQSSTLNADETWILDVVRRCWAGNPPQG